MFATDRNCPRCSGRKDTEARKTAPQAQDLLDYSGWIRIIPPTWLGVDIFYVVGAAAGRSGDRRAGVWDRGRMRRPLIIADWRHSGSGVSIAAAWRMQGTGACEAAELLEDLPNPSDPFLMRLLPHLRGTNAPYRELMTSEKTVPSPPARRAEVGLAQAGARSARWATSAAIVRFVLAFLVQVYFARLLGPDTYGVFATAALTLTMTGRFVDLGLGFALLRVQHSSAGAIRTAMTWQLLVSLVVSIALIAFAGPVANLLGDNRSAPLIVGLAASIVLSGPAAVVQTLLVRAMRNRDTAFMLTTSYFIGYCVVGIGMSLMGYGVWSLVMATFTAAVVQVLLGVHYLRPTSLRPRFADPEAGRLIRSGLLAMLTAMVVTAVGNLERFFIARFVGSAGLGHYSTAANLANVPTNTVIQALSPIFVTLGSRVSDDPRRIGAAYLQLITLICIVISPLYAVVAVLAPAIIRWLFGDQWHEAGPVFRVLLLAVPWFVAYAASTPVLWNTDRPHFEVIFQSVSLVAGGLVLYLVSPYGLIGIAWGAVSMTVVRTIVAMTFAVRATGLPLRTLTSRIMRGALVSMMAAAAAVWPSAAGRTAGFVNELVLPSVSGCLALVAILLLLPNLIDRQSWMLIGSMLPGRWRAFVVGKIAPRAARD